MPIALFTWLLILPCSDAGAQMGGGAMGGPGGGAPGGVNAPGPEQKPKFRDHIYSQDALPIRREKGDTVVAGVRIVGNQSISTAEILQKLQSRKGRFYDYEAVLGDIRRLNDMGSFDHVTFKTQEDKAGGMVITFIVHERPIIKRVVFHGNHAMTERELSGRAGLSPRDPLSEFTIESARRRLLDHYHAEGFNQAAVTTAIGIENEPATVVFRINEGPKERIADIVITGNTILSEARLKKIIKSRGPTLGVIAYIGNTADLDQVDADVKQLESTYHNLGFLTATVGRRIEYDETGKWLTITFVVNEGQRFKVNEIKIVGNQYITERSLRERLELKPGDMFDGTLLRKDVGEIVYGYGELGFIYAEVEPQTVMRDEENVVDLVYKITEGDRWKIGRILVNIEGEPHLMRETTMLNLVDMREGDWIDRRQLEIARRRLVSSQLLETNPQIADPPDIKVQPSDESY
jgi:outer membrane protein insertion porin family